MSGIVCSGRTPAQAAIDNLGDLQLSARLTGLEREAVVEARIVVKALVIANETKAERIAELERQLKAWRDSQEELP